MRCIRIEFHGFKRLADTSCNTDGKLIAFLGPNEAGKSSVLEGLDWLTNAELALPSRLRNRSLSATAATDAIVRATFALTDEDREAIGHLPFTNQALRFIVARYADGGLRTGIGPKLLRERGPFDEVRDELERRPDLSDDDLPPAATAGLALVSSLVEDPDGDWSEENDGNFDALVDWLREPVVDDVDDDEPQPGESGLDPDDLRLAELLVRMKGILQVEHPSRSASRILETRAPDFALFTEADRTLQDSYDLADSGIRDAPPQALANLLGVAGLDLNRLWEQITEADSGAAFTTERRANERLQAALGPKWRQESIDVQFKVDGSLLRILIVEAGEGGANTPINERSDGLRMFVALVAFLAWHSFEVPPILLIDEAETHLHYDAQADLLEVLAADVDATQVFYTTHSPGCLPRDLGTGVRLVSPRNGRRDASELRNDFWTNERPGFTPLLFAMGAGAAAFSAFRRAVLAEGPADMILLPSLIRLATGASDLSYQVAPGLANYRGSGLELEETAARVVYLVDGDTGGAKHANWLKEIGIPEGRIFELRSGWATEDYVHPDRYLEVINALISSNANLGPVALEDLDREQPISKAVADWCKAAGVKAPGKTTVASVLIGDQDTLRLSEGAKEALVELHEQMQNALTADPLTSAGPSQPSTADLG
ncbi:AAA domain-containing protein, putative AbiEii toxin, Type IV TA system [Plantibacter flavus]|uniref:Putative AbiEii toxin of type IV toxin-antitoxin system n=1 Tax=Plantibacter flavus TaxID=150123 RepID=A0A3N2C6T6_9MICO|nr:AAA family ATPase [Plantibacter flavus]ROR83232.1 putative AbiEii toxin of type IV toxin-antitoxin system [Plantibacter flavus]SMG21588.1 AAA domain-containing protein, putative AbiEii toxin, Type IV TA system [Plantibacter flavus]